MAPAALVRSTSRSLGSWAVGGVAAQLVGGREGAGQARGEGVGVGVDDPAHEADEGLPRLAVVAQGLLGGGDVGHQPVAAQAAEELLLAGVAVG
jgi:hypothetical protein